MQSNEQIAVFLDIENFIGFCHALKLPLDLSEILEKLREDGRIIILRSFGDLERSLAGIGESRQHGNLRRMLRDNLFNHEDIPYKVCGLRFAGPLMTWFGSIWVMMMVCCLGTFQWT